MRRIAMMFATTALVALAGACAPQEETVVSPDSTGETTDTSALETTIPEPTTATAELSSQAGSTGGGTVTFVDNAGGVDVTIQVSGLAPGTHGTHLHEGSECVGDFSSAGSHFNPANMPHGGPAAAEHHAGDFANVEVDASGNGTASWRSVDISLGSDANSVVGRAFIVHEKADDLTTQPTGDAGGRILCGVVQAGGAVDAAQLEGAANGTQESAPTSYGPAGTAGAAPGAAGT